MTTNRAEVVQIVVGFLVLVAVVFVGYWGISRLSRWVVAEPAQATVSIALAAYFEPAADGSPRLRVSGDVLEHGKPLEGRARVTVRRLNDASQQSVSAVITNGKFESGEQSAFRVFSKTDRLTIETDVSKPDMPLLAHQEIYINAFPPLRPGSVRTALIVLAVIAIVFFWAFTGVATPGKNQAAIIFSYCVMILFLALPFMAFYVLGRYQSVAQAAMDVAWSTPVGVLPAVPLNDSDGKPATGLEREWVLNIGGIVLDRSEGAATKSSGESGATGATSKTDANQAGGPDADPTTSPAAASEEQTVNPPEYVIEGGLVIPLYVLVLSIIGGAINMTRMLPVYQREAQSLANARQWFQIVGGELLKRTGFNRAGFLGQIGSGDADSDVLDTTSSKPEREDVTPAHDASDTTNVTILTQTATAEAVHQPRVEVSVHQPATADPLVASTGSSSAVGVANADPAAHPSTTVTVAPAPTVLTPVEAAAVWRQGLITQHMYLISAPFLAIAVFYLLDWLDLRKKALLVLASFSVGLISDKILSAILSVVEPVLKGKEAGEGTKVDVNHG